MTEFVEALRAIDHMSVEDCFLQSPMFEKAAAEITRLRAALEWIVGTALTEPEAMVAKARAALEDRT